MLDVNGVDGALRCVGAAQVHVYRSVRLTESAVVSGKLQLSLLLVSYDITGFIGRWDRFRFSTLHIGFITVRLHVMQRTVLLSQFCLSVCLSVCPSDACIVTKLNNAMRIF